MARAPADRRRGSPSPSCPLPPPPPHRNADEVRQLGFTTLPASKPDPALLDDKTIRDLHTLLMETKVMEGKLVCGNCGHEYNIHRGVANFLLPNHLGVFLGSCFCSG